MKSSTSKWIKEFFFVLTQVALIVLITVLVLMFTAEKYDRMFPLPPQSKEHEEYAYEPTIDVEPMATFGESKHASTDTNKKARDEYVTLDKEPMSFVKDKRDLNAQEGMWRAANYLVALTFGELVFGVAALIFLGWTLMETRKTADAAVKTAEAAEAAERAYVSVDFELRHVGPENIERSVIEVVAHVTNYGKV